MKTYTETEFLALPMRERIVAWNALSREIGEMCDGSGPIVKRLARRNLPGLVWIWAAVQRPDDGTCGVAEFMETQREVRTMHELCERDRRSQRISEKILEIVTETLAGIA